MSFIQDPNNHKEPQRINNYKIKGMLDDDNIKIFNDKDYFAVKD